jgi:hypothetical protein
VYLDALAELQDRLPSFPNEIAWLCIEEELGRPVGEVYERLSEQPVAAASLGQVSSSCVRRARPACSTRGLLLAAARALAPLLCSSAWSCSCRSLRLQVYQGVLRETGEAVAVKVQRPGIGEVIAVDMLLLRRLMAAVDDNLPQVWACVTEWRWPCGLLARGLAQEGAALGCRALLPSEQCVHAVPYCHRFHSRWCPWLMSLQRASLQVRRQSGGHVQQTESNAAGAWCARPLALAHLVIFPCACVRTPELDYVQEGHNAERFQVSARWLEPGRQGWARLVLT